MEKYNSFTVAEATDVKTLNSKVSGLLKEGWTPLGGISVSAAKVNAAGGLESAGGSKALDGHLYVQAFVKP